MQGIGCKVWFVPKRKDQVFCSPVCRKVARGFGVILMERSEHNSRLRVIIDGVIKSSQNAGYRIRKVRRCRSDGHMVGTLKEETA